MRTIKKVIAFLCMLGIAACFDAIMNNVLETSFIGDGWLDTTCRILTFIGRGGIRVVYLCTRDLSLF